MSTQLTIQPPSMGLTPAPNTNPDSSGNWILPSAAGVRWITVRFSNTGGSPVTVTFDDPTSVTPVAASQFNPDVAVSVPATTGVREFVVDALRFTDPATGRINWTYSGALTGTCEVVGVA